MKELQIINLNHEVALAHIDLAYEISMLRYAVEKLVILGLVAFAWVVIEKIFDRWEMLV